MLNEIIAKKATDLFEDSYTYENHINLDDTFEKVFDDLVDDEEFMEDYELTEDELADIAWKICEEEYLSSVRLYDVDFVRLFESLLTSLT